MGHALGNSVRSNLSDYRASRLLVPPNQMIIQPDSKVLDYYFKPRYSEFNQVLDD